MRKLTKRSQMLLYACGGMGVNMLNLMMGSFLCSAIIASGFGAEAVKNQTFEGIDLVAAVAWSVFGIVAKILDGVIDIPMASFTDRLKSRFGRRRPALIIGLVPMIIVYVLFALFTPDRAGVGSMLNTVYYGIILCIFYSFYTLTMVTYYATFTEIVETVEERNFISNVKSVCDIVYFILGYVLVPAMLKGFNIRIVAILVLPLVLTMLIPIFLIKEKSTLPEDVEKERALAKESDTPMEEPLETVNLFKSLAQTFRNRDYVLWMIVYSFMTFGVQLFLSGINEFFSVGNMSMMIVMPCAFAPVPFTLMIYNRLMKKKGFSFAFGYTMIVFGLSMVSMYFIAIMNAGTMKTVMCIVGGLIASFGIGSLFSVAYSVPAQLAADEEKKTGISNSAMYFAVQGLFSGIASGIGGTAVLTLLKKTDNVIYMTLIAAAGMLVALLSMFFLPKSVKLMGKEK